MRLIAALLLLCVSAAAQQRIVSTAPSITETLFALGLGNRVVGVSTYCHYPAQVQQLPRVGTYLKPNIEVIARLKPDLVIVQRLPNFSREQLQGLSIPVVEVDSGDLRRNLDSILMIGQATGVEAAARALIANIEERLAILRRAGKGRKSVSVAFIVGRSPGELQGLVAVGGGSYLSELLEIAGGANVFADSRQGYVKTSYESLLRRNPDVLIDMGEMAETTGVTEMARDRVVSLWGTRPALKAVQKRRVYAVASDIFVVPGPRMVEAAEAFASMLHGEPRP
jgi:iron complex transport system substrate-binding protein